MTNTFPVSKLEEEHKGQIGYVVGKGLSLLELKQKHFEPEGFIITLNHSINFIERMGLPNKIYSMQKDGCGYAPNRPNPCLEKCEDNYGVKGNGGYPKKAPLLLHEHESKECYPKHPERYIFDTIEDLGYDSWPTPSLPCAVSIAVLMGASEIKILCCDSHFGEATKMVISNQDGTYKVYGGYNYNGNNELIYMSRWKVPVKYIAIK